MNHPPAQHYRFFTKPCPCSDAGRQDRIAVPVRLQASGTGALMYMYRCFSCGNALTEFIPHKHIGDGPWIDLDAWCDRRESKLIARRFRELPGVFLPSAVLAPAPGEVPDAAVVDAVAEQFQYFVDEAGDPNLFGRKGRVIVGTQGCSRTFMIGAAFVADASALNRDLLDLHRRVVTDPQFQHIESLKASRGRTAIHFHASKDHPQIRSLVFDLLAKHQIKVIVVVRRKASIVSEVLAKSGGGVPHFAWQGEFDAMISRLFKDRLHLAKKSEIVIASRGASDRTVHLSKAVNRAKVRYEKRWAVINPHKITVTTASPDAHPGLQAVDYYLWALQRVYERDDFSAFDQHRQVYGVVVDVDDKRKRKGTGEYFTSTNPLNPKTIKPFEV